ncbi:MAG: DUF427 domain-containing protein [Thermoleophilaceae bacterium]|nr:DUF427 domain-containing protein [Thermoleophilaceae bacterium]
MTLTRSHGPLGTSPQPTVNYSIEGPPHRLLLDPFPRRVRGRLAGKTVVDTRRGGLLHESNILPQLYVPWEDVREDLVEASDHTTHCPFKGDAAYWHVRVGDRVAENAIWSYPEPVEATPWLDGLAAFYVDALDEWLDEEEPVTGHLRDPYHRVDVRRSSAGVRVSAGEAVVAESSSPLVLSETGLPNRFYLPREDVPMDLLAPSDTRALCPYKGESSYFHVNGVEDAAWTYEEPLNDARRAAGHISFDGAGVEVTVLGD